MLERLKTVYKFRYFLSLLVKRDFKVKYRNSILGIVWSLLNPLFISIIMYVVFAKIFGRGPEFFVYLTLGRTFYNFLSTGSNQAMGSVIGSIKLTNKVYIPKYFFPFVKVTVIFFETILAIIMMFLIMPISNVEYDIVNFFIVVPLLMLYIFTYGLGLILATYNVFLRDIQHIYSIILTVWMYLTPIFYPAEFLFDRGSGIFSISTVVKLNPLYYYITMARDAIMYAKVPQSIHLIVGGIFAATFFVIGNYVFLKNQDEFILHV